MDICETHDRREGDLGDSSLPAYTQIREIEDAKGLGVDGFVAREEKMQVSPLRCAPVEMKIHGGRMKK